MPFMSDSIKQELHQLVDKCDNETILEEAKELLEAANTTDWWDELSEEDKNLVMNRKYNMVRAISLTMKN